jgi:phosphatidate cytidylyltransferase
MIDSAFTIPPLASFTAVLYRLLAIMTVAIVVIWGRKNPAKKQESEALKKRFFTYVLVIGAYFATAYVGGLAFLAFVALLILGCVSELFRMVNPRDALYYRWLTGVLILVEIVFALGVNQRVEASGTVPFFYLVPPLVVALLALSPVVLQKPREIFASIGCTIFGAIYFGWFLCHLVLLRGLPNGFGIIVFLFMCVAFNDTLAYAFGRCFGKNKMSPVVSPAKTWEGFAGGIVGTSIGALVFYHVLSGISLPVTVLLAFITMVAAPLGDLVVSALKREFAAKDSGSLLPGHGGILDRFDSLVLTAPLYYYVLSFCA